MKRQKKRRLKQKISEMLDLPAGVTENLPGIFLSGNREMIIDGKCELVCFAHEEIILYLFSIKKNISVQGNDLMLKNIAFGGVKISGDICGIRFE